ncbi:MAG: hypothetical protein A2527_03180 [Candidatus Lambdaproteobacteria bacterium RIFOXYD2_FULL_50_16]|uniref:Uncharacterized protein n=1 Tax=Candidatus Lambdaproteobacteria bacterium RIFOXYD2_FULL_50_16 TaxID=1817772 RepID=A0A1F6GEM4_9PROT|nr:MAG: hypothetical protein A2527_03180 [Candidatus Lambdaproteobacteria bacterium RIFOXYD2_FULL_50_16]
MATPRLKLLGLGPKIQELISSLKPDLPKEPLSPTLEVEKETDKSRWFERVLDFGPHFLLIDGTGPWALLKAFLTQLKELDPPARPRVFLFFEEVKPFFAAWIEEGRPLTFRGLAPFVIEDLGQLGFFEEDPEAYRPLIPNPEFALSALGQLRPFGNLPLSVFEGLRWKGKAFEPAELFELAGYLIEEKVPTPLSEGFFLFENQLYLKRAYHLRELEGLEFEGLNIEGVIGRWDRQEESEAFELFKFKLNDLIRETGLLLGIGWALGEPDWLKEHLPIEIKAEHSAISAFARHHLLEAGFRIGAGPGAIPLQFGGDTADLCFAEDLLDIPFFSEISNKGDSFLLPPEEELSAEAVIHHRELLYKKKEKLLERQKALEGARLIQAQEDDTKVMVRRKLDLLLKLMERAELFVEGSDEMILKLGQDCLIFYEDERVAQSISRHLQGRGKNLFFDVGGFTSPTSLLTYRTDHLVSFLKSGHVLVTSKAKAMLLNKVERIKVETAHARDLEPDQDEEELINEKRRLEEAFEGLACLEAWGRTKPLFENWLPKAEALLAARARIRFKESFSLEGKTLALVTSSGTQYLRIKDLFAPTPLKGFAASPDLFELKDLPEDLDQVEVEPRLRLAELNRPKMARFFEMVCSELGALEADIILLAQPWRISLGLAEEIKKSPELCSKPLVLLFSEDPGQVEWPERFDLAHLPLYLGRHTSRLNLGWALLFKGL